jgi:two-component system, OmpR family, KDP operon response regulator KdpE
MARGTAASGSRQGADPDAPTGRTLARSRPRFDLGAKVVRRGGAVVHLTPTEWGILELLVGQRGRLVGRRQLLDRVWGPGNRTETSYLRVYPAQLRREPEPDPAHPRHLITEAGLGHRFRT